MKWDQNILLVSGVKGLVSSVKLPKMTVKEHLIGYGEIYAMTRSNNHRVITSTEEGVFESKYDAIEDKFENRHKM